MYLSVQLLYVLQNAKFARSVLKTLTHSRSQENVNYFSDPRKDVCFVFICWVGFDSSGVDSMCAFRETVPICNPN